MAIKLDSMDKIRTYLKGIDYRSDHHGQNVSEIIFPLFALIVLNSDLGTDISVKELNGTPVNVLWATINNKKYVFRYEHSDVSIEIKEESLRGNMVDRVDNRVSIAELKDLIKDLKSSKKQRKGG